MSDLSSGNSIEIPHVGSVSDMSAEAAWLGALLGLAVGDAVGTTYEFARIDQPPYPTLATGPATDLVGGGPFELLAGQVTDDTQMAVCLARSFVEGCAPGTAPGTLTTLAALVALDVLDIASRYVAWFQHAFDVGNQTASALSAIEQGTPAVAAGRDVWHRSGRRAAGNGSLMRTAPIGVWFGALGHAGSGDEHATVDASLSSTDRAIVEAALADSLITHADPRCAIACAAFNVAIARGIAARASRTAAGERSMRDAAPALRGAGPAIFLAARAMFDAARAVIPVAAATLRDAWRDDREDVAAIDAAEADLHRDFDAASSDDPQLYGAELHLQRTAGFVRVAFRLAFWHLLHTRSWRDAIVDVASRGGDADTNAAIAGALLGARDGVTAIPTAWIERVLAVTQPGPPDWAAAHHPRHLLALVDALRAQTAR